jgi:hypothetical protein
LWSGHSTSIQIRSIVILILCFCFVNIFFFFRIGPLVFIYYRLDTVHVIQYSRIRPHTDTRILVIGPSLKTGKWLI